MTVKELREKLEQLPSYCDGLPVVSLQPKVEMRFNGSNDEPVFIGFDDIELKKLTVDFKFVRLN